MAADSRVGSTSVLFSIVTISAFDRLCIAPLLAPIAADLGAAVSTITYAATAHFLCYGLFQLGHGWMSERAGRQRALRIALMVLGLGNLACALSPNVAWLVLGRAIAGAASGGLVPGALVSIADQPPGRERARRQTVLISALGVGTALAAVAGLGSRGSEWRIVFAATAVACLAFIVPVPVAEERPATVRSRVLEVARRPGVRFVALVGIPEGAAVFGFVVFFPLAVTHLGSPPEVAALSTAAVGLGMLLGGFLVRRLTGVLADRDLSAAGAALLAIGYGIAAVPAASAVFVAAFLAGLGQSALHAILQRWASEAAPDARGISAALFGLGIFGGAGLAALLGAALPNQFATLFLVSALCAVLAGVVASTGLPNARSTDATDPRPAARSAASDRQSP